MWQEVTSQTPAEAKRFIEIMGSMAQWYADTLTVDRLRDLLQRKIDAHAWYYDDGTNEVVAHYLRQPLLAAWRFQMVGAGRCADLAAAMAIVARKLCILLEVTQMPGYAVISQRATPKALQFYAAAAQQARQVALEVAVIKKANCNILVFAPPGVDTTALRQALKG